MPDGTQQKKPASPFILGMIVGGFVLIVMESLFFGFLAAIATGFLVNRDRREDEEERS